MVQKNKERQGKRDRRRTGGEHDGYELENQELRRKD